MQNMKRGIADYKTHEILDLNIKRRKLYLYSKDIVKTYKEVIGQMAIFVSAVVVLS